MMLVGGEPGMRLIQCQVLRVASERFMSDVRVRYLVIVMGEINHNVAREI